MEEKGIEEEEEDISCSSGDEYWRQWNINTRKERKNKSKAGFEISDVSLSSAFFLPPELRPERNFRQTGISLSIDRVLGKTIGSQIRTSIKPANYLSGLTQSLSGLNLKNEDKE